MLLWWLVAWTEQDASRAVGDMRGTARTLLVTGASGFPGSTIAADCNSFFLGFQTITQARLVDPIGFCEVDLSGDRSFSAFSHTRSL